MLKKSFYWGKFIQFQKSGAFLYSIKSSYDINLDLFPPFSVATDWLQLQVKLLLLFW